MVCIGLGWTLTACEPVLAPSDRGSLVWSDEFNGTDVNSSDWTFEYGAGGWGNNEKQTYNRQSSVVADVPGEPGNRALVITADRSGSGYTSSRLKTQGKQSWTYGRIVARLKLPEGQGIWPAFWMLGENISSVSWPRCGEIDIMEMVGGSGTRDRTTHGTLHWDRSGHQYLGKSLTLNTKLSAAFHEYAIDWTPQRITWMVDGQTFHSQDISGADMEEFHRPQFLLVNLAVGGQWPGDPDATTVFPQQYWIDWIRVYQN